MPGPVADCARTNTAVGRYTCPEYALECATMNDTRPSPKLGRDVFVAPTAYVGGDVLLGDQVTIMHYAVVRGDIAQIRIGNRVNIQDGAIMHTPHGSALEVGDDVGIAHRAVVHCAQIGSRTLVGIGSILLDECRIGSRCIIAAGSVLPPGTVVPDDTVIMGIPGKPTRRTTDEDLAIIDHVVRSYVDLGRRHAAGGFPNIASPPPKR